MLKNFAYVNPDELSVSTINTANMCLADELSEFDHFTKKRVILPKDENQQF